MRQSTIGRKPFRITGSSFSSHLLNNFEARLRMRNATQRTPTPIPTPLSRAAPLISAMRRSPVSLSAPPRPLLSVPDRFTMAYSYQIDRQVEKKKRLKQAELALLNRMNEKSTSENNRTWEHLRREGHSIVSKVVEGMGPVFNGKELRVRENGNVEVEVDVYKIPTNFENIEAPLGNDLAGSSSSDVTVATSKRLHRLKTDQYDSDDEFIAETSKIGPVQVPIKEGQLLKTVVEGSWVVTTSEVHEGEHRQKTRRVSKLAKSIEGASPKKVASVLASSLSKNELAKVTKALKKGGKEAVNKPLKSKTNIKKSVKQQKSAKKDSSVDLRSTKVQAPIKSSKTQKANKKGSKAKAKSLRK